MLSLCLTALTKLRLSPALPLAMPQRANALPVALWFSTFFLVAALYLRDRIEVSLSEYQEKEAGAGTGIDQSRTDAALSRILFLLRFIANCILLLL